MDEQGWTFIIEITSDSGDKVDFITHNLKRVKSFMAGIEYGLSKKVSVYSYYGVILE